MLYSSQTELHNIKTQFSQDLKFRDLFYAISETGAKEGYRSIRVSQKNARKKITTAGDITD